MEEGKAPLSKDRSPYRSLQAYARLSPGAGDRIGTGQTSPALLQVTDDQTQKRR